MRLFTASLVAACLAAPLLLTAADDGIQITARNNTLVVTAPADQERPPAGILSQRMTANFQDASISEVAEFLRRTTSLNVVVAPDLLARNAVVSLNVKDMDLGNLLNWIQTVGGVHYGWLHHALYFSDTPLTGEVRTRTYDVSDLVMPITNFPGPEMSIPEAGGTGVSITPPISNETEPTTTIDELVELLKKQVNAK